MRIPLFKRLIITCCNIFFPPLAVALLTGFTSADTFLNCVLFLLAIIPSHVHGFYIAIVYFARKRRVRNGKYPGKPHKAGIWSERVLTGGVGWDQAERMKDKHVDAGRRRHSESSRRASRRETRQSRMEDVERQDTRLSQLQQPSTLQGPVHSPQETGLIGGYRQSQHSGY